MKLILGIAIIVGAIWFATTKAEWVNQKFGSIFSVEPTEDVENAEAANSPPPMLADKDRSIEECRSALITVGEDILSPLNQATSFSPQQAQSALTGISIDLQALSQRDPLASRYLTACKMLKKALLDRTTALKRHDNSGSISSLMDGPNSRPNSRSSGLPRTNNAQQNEDFFEQAVITQWDAVALSHRQKVSPLLRP